MGVHPRLQHFFILFEALRGKRLYEQLVWEYCYVLIVGSSLVIVGSSRECVRTAIVLPRYVLQLDIVFFKFEYLSCNAPANLLWLSPVCKIGVVGVDYDLIR